MGLVPLWNLGVGHCTCSRVSCLAMVSFSIFLIFFISLFTWNSCSCSKCCSSSAFSCCSCSGEGGGDQTRGEWQSHVKTIR